MEGKKAGELLRLADSTWQTADLEIASGADLLMYLPHTVSLLEQHRARH
jgi:hypothetical protein